MLQLNFGAELAVKVGVEHILQDFPYHLVVGLLLQIIKYYLYADLSFFSVLFLFVCLFIYLFFSKRHQIKFHLFPWLGEKLSLGS